MSTPRHSWKTFLHYVIPSVSAMVLFSAYTIVDGIFVSKGVGELALAGVNIALPFINVLSGTAILLSMGTSTLCAFALGHGDHEKAEKIFTQTVVAIVAISAVITVAVSDVYTRQYAPIGYRKHPEIKNKLIIDEETRWIVEKIFDLAFHGRGAASITSILIAEKVPTPGFINFQRDGTFANIYAGAPEEKSYAWTIAQVKSIMKDETYIGHTIHYRETNISFKNKRRVRKPQSEWVRVENTQEPIISEQVFRQVQEQIANRRRKCKDGTTQIFSGLVKCADCGWSLSYGENRQNSKPYGHYHCSKYGQGTRQCSMHYIRYDVLYAYVLSRLQYWSVLAQQDGDKLLKRLLNASDKERNTARKRQTAELKKAEKRKAEVDTLFAKMYEDWSAGRITEYNFNMLSEKYQGEQRELDVKIERLHEAMETAAQTAVDAEKWIGLMKQYVNPTELTAELLNTLIEKILVHEAVKSEDGSREQEVEIFYRFIGKIE